MKSYSCALKNNLSNNLNVKLCLFNGKNKFYFLWGIIFSSSDLYHEKSLINQIGYWGYWVWIVSFTIALYEHLIWPIKLFYMDLKCDEKSCASCDMNFYITIFTNCFYMRHFVLSSRKIIKTLSTLYPFMHIFALCGIYNKTSLVC